MTAPFSKLEDAFKRIELENLDRIIPSKDISFLLTTCRKLLAEKAQLLKANEVQREALGFYADPYGEADLVDDNDYKENPAYPGTQVDIPGVRARRALAEAAELMKQLDAKEEK